MWASMVLHFVPPSYQQHRAGAALAPAAAVFNVSQVQLIPDDLKKGIVNGYVQVILLSIDRKSLLRVFS